MKVQLLKDVERLGKKGDIVGVFPRIARNLINESKAKDPSEPEQEYRYSPGYFAPDRPDEGIGSELESDGSGSD